MPPARNLFGKTFGKLIPRSDTGARSEQGDRLLLCDCTCGGQKTVRAGKLISGQTTSCGCKHPVEDLVGNKYRSGTVLRLEKGRRRGKERFWKLKCDCGEFYFATTNKLTSGQTTSCGHDFNRHTGDLSRQKFGKLTVTKRAKGTTRDRARLWHCACECGGKKIVKTVLLTSGKVSSCGCKRKNPHVILTRKEIIARYKARNVIEVHGKKWLAKRELIKRLGIGNGTPEKWKEHCVWLGRGIKTRPLEDGLGRTCDYFSEDDAELIVQNRHQVAGRELDGRLLKGHTFRSSTPMPTNPPGSPSPLEMKRRRGRPKGTIDVGARERDQKIKEFWEAENRTPSGAQLAEHFKIDPSYARRLIRDWTAGK
jgi:hypothetical protein